MILTNTGSLHFCTTKVTVLFKAVEKQFRPVQSPSGSHTGSSLIDAVIKDWHCSMEWDVLTGSKVAVKKDYKFKLKRILKLSKTKYYNNYNFYTCIIIVITCDENKIHRSRKY